MSAFLRTGGALAMVGALLVAPLLLAAEPKTKASAAKAPAESVELFEGMKNGDLEVKFIPKNDREGQVFIKNMTKKPLSVKLPDAVAGVPVLAQFGGGGGGGNNAFGGGNQNQSTGSTLGGGQGGGGGAAFNVAPEKVGKIKMVTVCLDHGKPDPNPRVPYELRPLESYNSNPGLAELMPLLANPNVSQRVVQAATWHIANGMTWEQLAAKRIKHITGPDEPYFAAAELRQAVQIATAAKEEAAKKPKSESKPAASASSQAANN